MFPRVDRPWGSFWTLLHPEQECPDFDMKEAEYAVKRIRMKPGERMSLQKHEGRNEVMVVVAGDGKFTTEDPNHEGDLAVHDVMQGYALIVTKGQRHRLEAGNFGMTLIEVWLARSGPEPLGYLSEDDIVRLEDDYGRLE